MTIRVTITKPGVTDAYGLPMAVGTTYTVEENFGLSIISQGRASDTDASLVNPGIGGAQPGDVVFCNAATLAAPTAQMLASYNVQFALDVAPFTRYVSNGTALVPAGSTGSIVGAEKIRGMLSAIGQAAYRRVNIGYHGHSIAYGVDSNSTGVYDAANTLLYDTKSQAAIIAKMLSAAAGGTGLNYSLPIGGTSNTLNSLITLGGGATTPPSGLGYFFGPSGWNVTLSAPGHTMAFTCIGTSVRVYAVAAGAASTVAARWSAPSVSGGATQTASLPAASPNPGNTPDGARTWYEFTISGLSAGEVVTLIGPSSSSYRVYFVDRDYQPSTAGVTVHRLVRPGAMLADLHAASLDPSDTGATYKSEWIGSSASTNGLIRAGQAASMSVRVPQDGVILQTFANDMNAWGGGFNYSLADQMRHYANYLSYHAALDIPVLVLLGPYRSTTLDPAGIPYDQADLINGIKQTVLASTNAAYMDFSSEWPGATVQARYDAELASGILYDTVHPGIEGHGYYGASVAQALLQAAANR